MHFPATHSGPAGAEPKKPFYAQLYFQVLFAIALGITIGQAHPWQVEVMDYPHARVRLNFCKVYDWQGSFDMREGQAMAWQTLPVEQGPVLPGTVPVLLWLAQERGHEGPTHIGG